MGLDIHTKLWYALSSAFDTSNKPVTDGLGNGALNTITNESGGQPHNRFIEDIAETEASLGHATWTEAEGVRRIRFRFTQGQGSGLAAGDIIRVVFDAAPVDDTTDTSQAWSWLTAATSSETTDVEYIEIIVPLDASADTAGADGVWSDWYELFYPLRRVDITYPGGTAAASANTIDCFMETE